MNKQDQLESPAPVHRVVGRALDLIVLDEYERPFFDPDDGWRDERIAKRTGICIKQVYALLNKSRYSTWIEYGVSLRSGWLTDEGKRKLMELRAANAPNTTDERGVQ
jgi:hypothetical protein